ncbi:MAG: LutC/YkgG family protein [Rhodospirillales bacterium]
MTAARETVLAAVRRRVQGDDRAAAARARLAAPPPGPLPKRAQISGEPAVERFIDEAARAGAEIDRLASAADIPAFVARYLAARNLPACVRVSDDPLLINAAAWDTGAPSLRVLRGAPSADDMVSVSAAFAGAAETGTLVLRADAENPGALASLPPHHIAVLCAGRVMGSYEQTWAALRRAGLPRTVLWVTGPSRTADIEQTLLMGAHGPQSLQILILGRADDT